MNMSVKIRKILSGIMALVIVVGLLPVCVFAAETDATLQASLNEAKAYIDGITIHNSSNDPATVVKNFKTHFTWDNEKRENSKSYLFDWSYYNGVVFEGVEFVYEVIGEAVYKDYVIEYMSSLIDSNGTWATCSNNSSKQCAGYNSTHGADCYKTASLLLDCYEMTGDSRYLTMAATLYADLDNAAKMYSLSKAGNNFRHTWASDPSPDLWLDGLYMILPFRAEYAKHIGDTEELDLIVSRMQWVSDNMYNSSRKLFYHAADSSTSNSGTFWLRSIGWYAAAIVDIMDSMSGSNLEAMKKQLVKLVDGMKACQNTSNGMWLNNMAASQSSSNPYETSGTALVCYAVMKAINNGWLDESYADMAILAFNGICREKLDDNTLKDICFKGAPGSSNSTFYNNEGKGVGPFIMFYAEVLDYVNNNRCDHVYEAVIEEATCVKAGSVTYTCALCEDSYREEIPATGVHKYESVTVDATETTDGSITYTCAGCKDSYVEVLPATGETTYSLDIQNGTVPHNAPASASTGAQVVITAPTGKRIYADVTLGMVSRNGNAVSTSTAGTMTGLTVTYEGVVVSTEFTLVVEPAWIAMPDDDKGEATITQSVGAVSSGSYYLLRNRTANKYLTGTATGNRLNFGTDNTNYWYVTRASGNTYYIQYGGPDGQYLTIGDDSAELINTATAITLSYVNTDNAHFWDIQQDNQHLNNYRKESNYASGWTGAASDDDGSCWYLDQVSFGSRSYVLDTDGMNPGEAYLILDDDQGKALTLSGTTVGNASVTVKDNTVSISGSANVYEFFFADNSKESGSYLLSQDGSRTIKHSGGNLLYVASSDSEYNQGYWHIEHVGNGRYKVYDINGNNWYLNYGYVWANESVSSFAVSSNSRDVRLFKYTETESVGGYARLMGETSQIYITANAVTESDVLSKVIIQSSADGISTDSTQIPVTASMTSWDKTFSGTSAGTYVGTVSYEGNVLGTVTVTITLEHAYETITVDATCTEDGSITTRCTVCGEQTVEVIKAAGHNYECAETAATCGKDGAKVYTCSLCKDAYTESIPATGNHKYETTTVDATCTKDGSVTTTCTVCGKKTVEAIATLRHDYKCVETAATCGSNGSKVYTCGNCGDTYTETTPATGKHSYEAVRVEPTCVTKGSVTYTCAVCGHSYAETIPATGKHIYNTETVKATCTEDGAVTYTCALCNDSYCEVIQAPGHNYTCEVTDATCTEAGSKVYACSVCGDAYSEEIPANGHDYKAVVTVPTCTEGGFTTYTCAHCSDSYVADDTAALGHSYEKATVEATCTKDGSVTYYCGCGDTYSEVIPSTGHNYKAVVTAPTCIEGGYTTNTCVSCGDSYVSDNKDALGHTNETVVVSPTCTIGGYTTDTCSVCGEGRIYDETAALGHDYVTVTVDPTETEGGYTTHTCNACGHSYTDNYVDALGHTIVSVVTDPTCLTEGYTTHTCTVCGEETVDTYVPALGHNHQTVTVDATCTVDGSVTKTCTNCGDTSTEVIGAYGHDYAATVTAPTCTDGGHTVYSCSRCGDNYVADHTEAIGHNYTSITVDVTCTEDGYTSYLCTNCGDSYVGETVAALGHNYETVTADATCTEDGSITHVCSLCGDSRSEVIPATGHDYKAVVTAPTCTEGGFTTYTCACGQSYVDDETAATGHSYSCVEENGDEIYTCDSCGDSYIVSIGWVALSGTYVLDTDGVDPGAANKYVVVGDDANQALTLSGTTVGKASVNVVNNTITLDNASEYEFYFQPSGDKLLLTQDGNRTVYHENASMKYGNSNAGKWNVYNKGNGKYQVVNADGNGNWSLNYGYVWGNDSSSNFAVSYYERHVRLFKATNSYVRLCGARKQTWGHGADVTEHAVLSKVQIQTSANGITADTTATVTSSMVTWDKAFDGYTAGTYTATVNYQGEKLGTITVIVTGEHTYEDIVVEATCTKNGSITHTCTACGKSNAEDIPATGHSYSCVEENGDEIYTCDSCGDSYIVSIGWVALPGTYVLDTDGVDTGAANKYMVVGADANQALTLSGTTVGKASVNVVNDTITLDNASMYEFYFQPSGDKLLLTQDGNRTVYHENASMKYGNSNAGKWNVYNKGNGKYQVVNSDGNGNWSLNYGYVWGNDSSSNFAVSYYERHVRLFKATDSYARLCGARKQTWAHGAEVTEQAVLSKVQIQTSEDGSTIGATTAVDRSMVTWDKAFDGYTAGTYTATVTYKGQKLDTITVTVTGEHNYNAKEENGKRIYTCSDCGHSYSENLYAKANAISGGNNYIIMLTSGNKHYAMSHKDNKISAVQMAVSDNKITGEITEDLVWTSSNNKLSYTAGNTTYYLYAKPGTSWWGWSSTPTLTISNSNSTNISFSSSKLKMGNYYLYFSNSTISLNSNSSTVNVYAEQ